MTRLVLISSYHFSSQQRSFPIDSSRLVSLEPSFLIDFSEYTFNHYSDQTALDYVRAKCGQAAAEAYSCLLAPSYRADLFRFCALTAEGGIYLDEDIMPLVPLRQLYAPCMISSIGHDFPVHGGPAKQMKILAATIGHNVEAPIFKKALDLIIHRVRLNYVPENSLELTGPAMLQKIYEQLDAPEEVAITYIDTSQAQWPFAGLRAGNKVLAYEIPSEKHFTGDPPEDERNYASLYDNKKFYADACSTDQHSTLQKATSNSARIPRQVFVTWKTEDLSESASQIHQDWIASEPTVPRHIITDDKCRELALYYPDKRLIDIYDSFPLDVMRSDICRLLAIHAYGGIYMDLDVVWTRPLDTFFDFSSPQQIQIGWENDIHYSNWMFGSSKNHPCIEAVLDLVIERGQNININKDEFVHYYSGPAVFTEGIKSCGATPSWVRYEMISGNIKHEFASTKWKDDNDYKSWTHAAADRGLNVMFGVD